MFAELLPLLAFTTFAGLAAGAYAIDAVCGNARVGGGSAAHGGAAAGSGGEAAGIPANAASDALARPWLFPLVCLVLLGVGLCGTLAHLGQPLRFLNGMSNPGSMIAQEAYWSIAFGAVILVDLVLAWRKGAVVRPVRWVGGLVALGLMAVTGLAYCKSLGLPAWNGAATIPLFVLGDLALGAGLCALLDGKALRDGHLAAANVAAGVAFATVLCAFGLHLARIGLDATGLLVAAGIAGPVGASVAAAAACTGKLPVSAGGIAVCVLATVGVVLARIAFFAAGMLS